MLIHWIWFSCVQELSGRQKLALIERFRNPEDIYYLDSVSLRSLELSPKAAMSILNKDLGKAQQILRTCTEKGIGVMAFTDSTYPARLKNIDDPPMVLYYLGQMPALELRPVIGVVGTRKASAYGLRAATAMGEQIGACGGIVASGGAFGIDSMALQGALDARQQTIVVQAGGLDTLYPKGNQALFDRVLEKGCMISEYPPGVPAYRGNFLRRNRIISGISNGVLVVEAPKISGALNTARWASEQGRDVFVVPGNIDVESCAGSNALIGDIAHAALSGWAVMKEYEAMYPDTVHQAKIMPKIAGIDREDTPVQAKADKIIVDKRTDSPYSVKEKSLPNLSEQEKTVVAVLSAQPVAVDQIIDQLGLPPATVMTVITKLSVKGVVKLHPGKLVSVI